MMFAGSRTTSFFLAGCCLLTTTTATNELLSSSSSISRQLLTNSEGQPLKVTLRFSLWFPDFWEEDYQELSSDDAENPIRQGVLASVMDVICNEDDLIVTDPLVGDSDICPDRLYQSSDSGARTTVVDELRRKLQDETRQADQHGPSSFLSSVPEVIVRTFQTEELLYSTWIVQYPVLLIGDIYIQEAIQNEPNLPYAKWWDSSVKAMEQVIQLALDVSIMEENFDTALRDSFKIFMKEPPRVYSSPIRKEEDGFGAVLEAMYEKNAYVKPTFSAMRAAGIVMLILTLLTMMALQKLAKRRRRAIIRQERKVDALRVPLPEKKLDGHLLVSPEGVEEMLERSSSLLPGDPAKTRSRSVSSRASRASRATRGGHRSISRDSRLSQRDRSIPRDSRVSRVSRASRGVSRSISRDSRLSKPDRSLSRDSRVGRVSRASRGVNRTTANESQSSCKPDRSLSRDSRVSGASQGARRRSVSRSSRSSKKGRSISRDSRASRNTAASEDDGSVDASRVNLTFGDDGSIESFVPSAVRSSAASHVSSVGLPSDDEDESHGRGISMQLSMDSDDSNDVQTMLQLPDALKAALGYNTDKK